MEGTAAGVRGKILNDRPALRRGCENEEKVTKREDVQGDASSKSANTEEN